MARAIILMLDSLGVGAAADAHAFGDQGANTFGHIARACFQGKADEHRRGPLKIPNLVRLGFARLAAAAVGHDIQKQPLFYGLDTHITPEAYYGYAQEISHGKDTPSGHWEMAGVPVLFDWHYFPKQVPTFPQHFLQVLLAQSGLTGVLGNCHASGTEIIAKLGEEHMRTGQPILYTSADSVLQIAAHEETFGLEALFTLCQQARFLLDQQGYKVARVIARPFQGQNASNFKRTGNRRDYSVLPPEKTLLVHNQEAGNEVISIGKIADIYAQQGITQQIKATGNQALFDATLTALKEAPHKSIIFPNFVDFDMEYGHRRDVAGYARALEQFDARLPELEALLQPNDLVFITADHGCDPTWPGSDHTREYVPVVCFGRTAQGKWLTSKNLGRRDTFADIGQSIASHLGLAPLHYGHSFLE